MRWWLLPDSPKLIESLPKPPGSWLIDYLDKIDRGKHPYPGGSKQWIRDLDLTNEEYKKKLRERESELNQAKARSVAHHYRDYIRGDPLAGQRRWVHTSPIGFTPAGRAIR